MVLFLRPYGDPDFVKNEHSVTNKLASFFEKRTNEILRNRGHVAREKRIILSAFQSQLSPKARPESERFILEMMRSSEKKLPEPR